ncbi:MAG: ATP-binding cassette domain-containing protein, partial [Verrucomicrobiales bacterium]|nr:ATP-binding cassette domain-containing protein [Verrucomicrobiales bacterium]
GAFVEQQPYLFVGSVRDNITLGSESVTDEEVRGALREVGLEELIQRRGGLDHVLTDRGRNLSVGQQYRLALCRALVCGRPFLLMDEPFAALDIESVELVSKAMQQEKAKGTGIMLITHLLPEHLNADRVVEMVAQNEDTSSEIA